MGKAINIKLVGLDFDRIIRRKETVLCEHECNHILSKVGDVSNEELTKAVDTIITYFANENICALEVDIDARNRELMPPKEMTIKDIEEKLGYKVKIVSEKVGA